tara:strand:+ start:116 stop:226 length:111 start_codon:yes stop_codon:yes gene_type:complete
MTKKMGRDPKQKKKGRTLMQTYEQHISQLNPFKLIF